MKNTEQLISKAITFLNQGKNERAKVVCEKIITHTPLHYQANLLLGVIAINTLNSDIAETHLRIAAESSTTKHDKAQALNNLSLALSHQHRLTEALVCINEAIKLKQQPLFYCNRANLFEQLSRWSDMRQDLLTTLSLSPDITDAYISLAVANRHLDNHSEARKVLTLHTDITDQDWLNEWTLLSAINQQLDNIRELLNTMQLSDDAMIALGDYALEQNYPDVAEMLYLMIQEYLPNHPVLEHQLNALQGVSSSQAPREYVESLFDNCATQFEDRLIHKLHYRLPDQLIEQAYPFLPSKALQVIDLGCGTGLLGKALSSHALMTSLTGIDLSAQMLEQASKTHLYHHLIHGDIVQNLVPSNNIDLIMAADVLIYLGDLFPLFNSAFHALTSEGLFIFSIECCENQWQLTSSGRYRHSKNYIRTLAEKNGFIHLHTSKCQLRLEKNQPVAGEIIILQKN